MAPFGDQTTTIEELETLFDAHPSLDASLQDFEHSPNLLHSPRFGDGTMATGGAAAAMYPSHHSGFRLGSEATTEEEMSETSGRYSPPAWRVDARGNRSSGFWGAANHKSSGSAGNLRYGSRESSPEYESADDGREDDTLAAAARTRLPTGSLSPEKRRSPSPDPYPKGNEDFGRTFGAGAGGAGGVLVKQEPVEENTNNYIRFAVRAEVQHKTDPYTAIFSLLRNRFRAMTASWFSLISSITIALVSILAVRTLFQPGFPPPVPDLVKVAGLARAFEPLIFYSENGAQQIGDLQATGIAVWDLGESVRSTNMTSAPIIVKALDDLSESLKILAVELSRFFANVDGDVDGILIVMDWARRELSQLQSTSPSPITSAYDNIHTALSHLGVLESPLGTPTRLGHLTTTLLGPTSHQRTRHTLQRTFTEFLSVLEDSITSELSHSLALFSLFEAIDRQFLNLARTVIREADAQDEAQDELLSSLWTRILGPDSSSLHKFEKNRTLLKNIRAKTVQNKSILEEHNRKLLTLKANLENLRRKLVSPLLRANASTIGVEEQIRGLEEVGTYLGGVRERQKGRLMELLYGAGRPRDAGHDRIADREWDR